MREREGGCVYARARMGVRVCVCLIIHKRMMDIGCGARCLNRIKYIIRH